MHEMHQPKSEKKLLIRLITTIINTTSKIPWEAKHWMSKGISPSSGTKIVLIYWLGCTVLLTAVSWMFPV